MRSDELHEWKMDINGKLTLVSSLRASFQGLTTQIFEVSSNLGDIEFTRDVALIMEESNSERLTKLKLLRFPLR